MNLVIDIGNTLTKLSIFHNDKEIFHKPYKSFTSNDLKKACTENSPIKSAIISAVGVLPGFISTTLKELKIQAIELSHETSLPISLNYNTPETLGMDRVAGVIGAQAIFPDENCLVIDAGTAITYDLITSDAVYEGGSISPGLRIRFDSLHNYTQKLPLLTASEQKYYLGKSTKESIISGVQNGILFEMEGQISYFKKIYDDLRPILTGGDTIYFEKYLKKPIFVVPNLIGIGLNNILKHNVE